MRKARNLRETCIYIINTALKNNNYLTTNTVYVTDLINKIVQVLRGDLH